MRQQIGQAIKKIRQSKGLTQRMLANRLNVNSSTIHRVETGKWNNLEMIEEIAKVLGFTGMGLLRVISSGNIDEELRFEKKRDAIKEILLRDEKISLNEVTHIRLEDMEKLRKATYVFSTNDLHTPTEETNKNPT